MKGFDSAWYEAHKAKTEAVQKVVFTAAKAKQKRQKLKQSKHHDTFEHLWKMLGFAITLPFIKEFKFHSKRRFRFDYAWPNKQVALEIDGGCWLKKGGHTTGVGKTRDCKKDFLAAELGWRIIRWTPDMINGGNVQILAGIIIDLTKPRTPIRLVSNAT